MNKPFKLTDADMKAIRTAEARFGSAEIRVCVRDLFVLGLHLIQTGKERAGVKACSLALRTLGLSETRKQRIMRNLVGNEHTLSSAFEAHVEFNMLIARHRQKQP